MRRLVITRALVPGLAILIALSGCSGIHRASNSLPNTPPPNATDKGQTPNIPRVIAALNSPDPAVVATVIAPQLRRAYLPRATQHWQVKAVGKRRMYSNRYGVTDVTVTTPQGRQYLASLKLVRLTSTGAWQIVESTPKNRVIQSAGSPGRTTALNTALVADVKTTDDESCPSGFGTKVPVLFVHGFNEGSNVWGKEDVAPSMQGYVHSNAKLPTDSLNYGSFSLRWVTDPHIGAALAARVTCLASHSRQQGGSGQVVVVAHSMGGLALREAIHQQPGIKQYLGGVVTIATPNNGSDIDRSLLSLASELCAEKPDRLTGLVCGSGIDTALETFSAFPALATGSAELAALTDWPKDVPVYAIAGNIRPTYRLYPWLPVGPNVGIPGPLSDNDTLVSTSSALHGNVVRGLGGTAEFDCTTDSPLVLPFLTKASCDHQALLNNEKVQASVVRFIQRYLSQTTPKAPKPKVQRQTAKTCSRASATMARATHCTRPPLSLAVRSPARRLSSSPGSTWPKQQGTGRPASGRGLAELPQPASPPPAPAHKATCV